MYFVYILESEKNRKYYIGQTEKLESRLERHNAGRVNSTKSGKPWKLIYWKNFETRGEAYKVEQLLKSFKKRDRVIRFAEENEFSAYT
ncbi:MAG: GIY-YIG nuclease family protein [Bacteroidota bacterium]